MRKFLQKYGQKIWRDNFVNDIVPEEWIANVQGEFHQSLSGTDAIRFEKSAVSVTV